ncbi:MAG: glucuronate isomerase [Clostridia bacterium]|nr:glucuronate isomerase [Clostridia bacterium]
MKSFMDENFLLSNKTASFLYKNYASKLPTVDFCCQIPISILSKNRMYSNISEILIENNRLVQTQMRSGKIEEKYITGNASDYEKFSKLCSLMPSLIGNPVYILCHMALRKIFECGLIICDKNRDHIWSMTAENLNVKDIRPTDILKMLKCELVAIKHEIATPLSPFKDLTLKNDVPSKIIPAYCPDSIINTSPSKIADFIKRFGITTNTEIFNLESLINALSRSLDDFKLYGCVSSEQTLMGYTHFEAPDPYHASEIMKKFLYEDEKGINEKDLAIWRGEMLYYLGKEYKKREIVMGLRFEQASAYEIYKLLLYLNEKDALPRTVLYASDVNEIRTFTKLAENLRDSSDKYPEITVSFFAREAALTNDSIKSTAYLSPLGKLTGVSPLANSPIELALSDVFRRNICNFIGEASENGSYFYDTESLPSLISDICFNNSMEFFKV